MGTVMRREACPECRKSGGDTKGDNLVVFSDGSKCFACGYIDYKLSDKIDADGGLGVILREEERIHEFTIPARKISEATCKFFGCGTELINNKIIFEYKDYRGKTISQKVRTKDKQFYNTGDTSNRSLYGQWLWEPNEQLGIVITEGEIDALSIAEVQQCKWPVVSIPNGIQGAKKSIQKNLKWLQGFKHVTLAFDNDDAGMKGIDECVELFEPGKVRIASWGHYKDANEALLEPGGKECIKNVLLRARTYMPEKIVTVHDIRDRIMEKPEIGLSWPWPSMTELTRGVRMQELTVLMGPQSVGKTTLSLECVHHMAFVHGMKCGIMSFEQSAEETYQVLAGMQINKNLLDPATQWETDEIVDSLERMDNRVYTCDDLSPKSFNDIKTWIMYFSVALGCQFLLIDNLSNIAVTFDHNEQRGIQKAMVALFDLARILDTHILLMTHVTEHNKTGAIRFEDGRSLRASDARGSDSIGQHCTAMFGLERNAISEEEDVRNVLTMRCLKMRKIGTSLTGQLMK